jgi:hypothetical protein
MERTISIITSADNKFKLIPYSSAPLRDMVSETRKFIYAPPYDQSMGAKVIGFTNSLTCGGSMVCFPKKRSAKIRRALPILSKSRVMKRVSTGLWGKASMIICEG